MSKAHFICCLIACCLGCMNLAAQDKDLHSFLGRLGHMPDVSFKYTVHYTSSSGALTHQSDYEFCHCAGAYSIKYYSHPTNAKPRLEQWLAYDGEVYYLYIAGGRILSKGRDPTRPALRNFVPSLFAFNPCFSSCCHAFYLGSSELFCLPSLATAESLSKAAPDLKRVGFSPAQFTRTSKDGSIFLTTLNAASCYPEVVATDIPSEKKKSLMEVIAWSPPFVQHNLPAFIFPMHVRYTMTQLETKVSFVNFEIIVDPSSIHPFENMSPAAFQIPVNTAKRVVDLDSHTSMEIK
jgi:hypothetical protein